MILNIFKSGLLSILFLFQIDKLWASSFDQNSPAFVSQPSDCFSHQKVPCVLKALKRQALTIKSAKVIMLNQSMIRILNFDQVKMEILEKSIVIQNSKDPVVVNNYELKSFPSFARALKDSDQESTNLDLGPDLQKIASTEIIDGQDLYLNQFDENEELLSRRLLDRFEFAKYISTYFDSLQDFKSNYKKISVVYNKSFNKDLALQKRIIQRKIASQEQIDNLEKLKNQKIIEDQKKQRELLFKRTFKR